MREIRPVANRRQNVRNLCRLRGSIYHPALIARKTGRKGVRFPRNPTDGGRGARKTALGVLSIRPTLARRPSSVRVASCVPAALAFEIFGVRGLRRSRRDGQPVGCLPVVESAAGSSVDFPTISYLHQRAIGSWRLYKRTLTSRQVT